MHRSTRLSVSRPAVLEAFAELLSDGGLHDAWRADD